MADYTDQESIGIMQQVNEEMRIYGRLTGETSEKLRDMQLGTKGATKSLTGAADQMGQALKGLTKATYRGEQGLSQFNETIEAGGKILGALVGLLAVLNPGFAVLAAGIVGFSKLLGEANKMSDRTFNAYKRLAEVGGSAGETFQGLRNKARDFDYTLGEADEGLNDFVQMLYKNAETLAYYKGSVNKGANATADLMHAFTEYRDPLSRLGLSTEAQNQSVMNYINYSAKLGTIQGKTNEQLAASARKYIMETEALSVVTGKQRETIEQERASLMREQQFRAKIELLRLRGETKQAERLENIGVTMANTFTPSTAKAMRNTLTGYLQTAEAQQLSLVTSGESVKIAREFNEGRIDELEASTRLQKALAASNNKFIGLQATAGDMSDVFGVLADQLDDNRRANGDVGKAMKAAREEVEESTKKGKDGEKDRQNEARRNQKEAAKSLQGVVEKFIEVAGKMTAGLSSLWNSLSGTLFDVMEGFSDFFDWISFDILKKERKTYDEAFAKKLKQEKAAKEQEIADFKKSGVVRGPVDDEGRATMTPEQYKRELDAQLKNIQAKEAANESKRGIKDATAERRRAFQKKYGTDESKEVAPGTAAAAPGAPARKGYTAHSNESLSALGLTLVGKGGAQGDRQAEGAQVSDKLIELAQKIKSSVPGFAGFTGFNDNYHREEIPNSGHAQGLSVDFVLNKKPSREEGQRIVDMLKKMGASVAKDEYHDPSSKATGPHFHASVPEGRYGGIFEGPRTGYAAVMHGREAILPLPNGQSIPIAIDTEKIIESFSEALKRTSSSTTSTSSSGNDLLSTLLDMVRLQRDQNDLVSQLLRVQQS